MSLTSEEVFIGRGLHIYLADAGTALPANDSVAPGASFHEVGHTAEEGVQMNYNVETQDIKSHQSRYALRTVKTDEAFQFTFSLMQWNDENISLAFGGGDWTNIGGVWKYSPPDIEDDVKEYALVADVTDGDINLRVTAGRCVVESGVETSIAPTAASLMPITLKALMPSSGDPFNFLSDDVQFS